MELSLRAARAAGIPAGNDNAWYGIVPRILGNSSEENFQENLDSLKMYKEEFGHCRVRKGQRLEVPDGVLNFDSLHTWVTDRRREYHDGELSTERIDALEELGFIWDGN